jgi:hypothetical protein
VKVCQNFEKPYGIPQISPEKTFFFLENDSVFDENIDEKMFPCMIYLLPDRIWG